MESWGLCMGCTAQRRQNFEVQRTIKRAELTAFLCLLKKVISRCMWTTKELLTGYGEESMSRGTALIGNGHRISRLSVRRIKER